jgi:hypothetical protein
MTISAADRVHNEGDTFIYRTYLVDENGEPIALADIVTATLTLFVGREDEEGETPDIVNSRNAQNILNANNVTIHATSGLLTWRAQPGDTTLFSSEIEPGRKEPHTAKFKITYDTDRVKTHFLTFYVLNRART